MAEIIITFEKRENSEIPQDQWNYNTTMKIEGGVPAQVVINALTHYLDQIIQFYEQQKILQLGQSKTPAEIPGDGSISNESRSNNEHENAHR